LAAEDAAKEAEERATKRKKAATLSRRQRKRQASSVAATQQTADGGLDDELPAPEVVVEEDEALPAAPTEFAAALRRLGHAEPTRVQADVWAAACAGRDVLAIDAPGTGKTFAYLFPVLAHALRAGGDAAASEAVKAAVQEDAASEVVSCPLALIILPARELVLQVLGEARKAKGALRSASAVSCQGVHGGVSLERHVDALAQQPPSVLIGTPGRCRALLEAGVLSLQHCSLLVLDEADKTLGDAACGADTAILRDAMVPAPRGSAKQRRRRHQTMLLSATLPPALREETSVLEQWLHRAVHINLARHEAGDAARALAVAAPLPSGTREAGASAAQSGAVVTQDVQLCAEHKKPRKLLRHLEQLREQERAQGVRTRARVLIFTNTIKAGRFVTDLLRRHDHQCALLHGGSMPQERRQQLLTHFRAGKLPILVATDLAARGLHITGLERVVCWDFPSNLEQYTHRVGRAGRAGCPGYALSFITRGHARIAPSLVAALRAGGHAVDENLEQLAQLVTEHMGAGVGAGDEEEQDDRGGEALPAVADEDVDEPPPPARIKKKAKRPAADPAHNGDAPAKKRRPKHLVGGNEWDDEDGLLVRAPLF
jgi:ATP-dependent RNA helicase DDX5/DBP2